jgi:hypothetical protein
MATRPWPSTTFSDLFSISFKAPPLARPRFRRSAVVLGHNGNRKLAQPATGPLAHRIIRFGTPGGRAAERVSERIHALPVGVVRRAVGHPLTWRGGLTKVAPAPITGLPNGGWTGRRSREDLKKDCVKLRGPPHFGCPAERWLSGLKRTPGEREWAYTPPGVRISLSPPIFTKPNRIRHSVALRRGGNGAHRMRTVCRMRQLRTMVQDTSGPVAPVGGRTSGPSGLTWITSPKPVFVALAHEARRCDRCGDRRGQVPR